MNRFDGIDSNRDGMLSSALAELIIEKKFKLIKSQKQAIVILGSAGMRIVKIKRRVCNVWMDGENTSS